ncbi:MAG: hypothetical protein OJF62_003772 [Pseudolabrys sp.]|nr:hypothetical protein [Pseudolabrys sp.]
MAPVASAKFPSFMALQDFIAPLPHLVLEKLPDGRHGDVH